MRVGRTLLRLGAMFVTALLSGVVALTFTTVQAVMNGFGSMGPTGDQEAYLAIIPAAGVLAAASGALFAILRRPRAWRRSDLVTAAAVGMGGTLLLTVAADIDTTRVTWVLWPLCWLLTSLVVIPAASAAVVRGAPDSELTQPQRRVPWGTWAWRILVALGAAAWLYLLVTVLGR